MCRRYVSTAAADTLIDTFDASLPLFTTIEPNWNVAPSQLAPVIRRKPDTRARQIDLLSWGLVPAWSGVSRRVPGPFTTLSEATSRSGLFQDTLADRRCLVPADAYYAWHEVGTIAQSRPYAVARRDGAPLVFAGLWDVWWGSDGEVTRSFSILTAPANAETAILGATMPVILEQQDWALWLGEVEGDPQQLLRAAADDLLEVWQVARAVNAIGNNGPELLDHVAETTASRSPLEFA